MAFVNELISEEDKQNIDWTRFKAWQFSRLPNPHYWTVDRDKNIFFVLLTGRGREDEHPEVYALCYGGQVIRIEAEIASKGNPSTGSDVVWKIIDINIPENSKDRRDAILTVLKEAIEAHGYLNRINPINSVRIEFGVGV